MPKLPGLVPPGAAVLSVAYQVFIPDPAGALGLPNSNAIKLIVL